MPSVWIDLAKAKRRLEGKKGGTFDFCLPGTAVYSLSTVLWDLSLLTGSLSAPSRTARHQLSHNDGLPLTFEPCPAVLPACHFVVSTLRAHSPQLQHRGKGHDGRALFFDCKEKHRKLLDWIIKTV
jgi:hypothetical protein